MTRTRTTQTRIRSSFLAALAISAAGACSNHSIELSTPPKIRPSTDPMTVGSINEQVVWLAVDEERLYWIGTLAVPQINQTGSALRSCKKNDCSHSLVTYDPSNVEAHSGFGLHDGEIYWRTVAPTQERYSSSIVACATASCTQPRRVLDNDHSNQLAVGGDAVYVARSEEVLRIPFSGSESATPIDLGKPGAPLALAVHGGFLYWLGQAETGGRSALYRTRSDGSSASETLADQLKLVALSSAQNSSGLTSIGLAFDDTYVYWTENTLTGSLLRCPLAGCSPSPEVLAAPIRAPLNLRPDGARVYFQYQDPVLGNSLSSCLLADCEPSAPIAHGLTGWGAIAIDDHFVYAATNDQLPNPDQYWDTPSAQIRRFPK